MVDLDLQPRSALAASRHPGLSGRPLGEPGVVLAERLDLDAFMLLARKGQGDALRDRLVSVGLDLPQGPRWSEALGIALVGVGPDVWLGITTRDEMTEARQRFEPLALLCTLVEAGDARTILTVSGPRARDALAKLLTIDLHPRAFAVGSVAATVAGGISVLIWQVDPAPSYTIAVPRSFAKDLWHWLTDAAAEYGCLTAE
ncbi:sarcosine oxidase subunit gamma [Lichenihabitans psoromatis]|uniref:sarcosine oxidase subunit gamma n=1 Tax=Lichenihabitans psoromatis TaxID=2528642 RepID=UPI0010385C27|nr:sarcosine oxidase subunit gamma family protein [Lichenihabitans psoromatis]